MRHAKVRPNRSLRSTQTLCNRREQPRAPVEFGLMYSAETGEGSALVGDGTVMNLSRHGLCIRGNRAVRSGMELTLFLYLPDGQDPLFVMGARVAWSSGHRFGVKITGMNLREQNRLRYFLTTNLRYSREH